MTIHCIYLAGPIANRSDAECVSWRNWFTAAWDGEVRNPLSRDYRYYNGEDHIANQIVQADMQDIDDSDALVVMYDGIPSVGTSMEMFYAYQLGKKVVLVDNSPEDHIVSPWLVYHCHVVVGSLHDAVVWFKEYNEL